MCTAMCLLAIHCFARKLWGSIKRKKMRPVTRVMLPPFFLNSLSRITRSKFSTRHTRHPDFMMCIPSHAQTAGVSPPTVRTERLYLLFCNNWFYKPGLRFSCRFGIIRPACRLAAVMRVLLRFKTKVAIADAANRWGVYACRVITPSCHRSFSSGYALLLWRVQCIM
ncbi:hypothetical protein J3E74DRAFT_323512 [Bipolaris maydis]|nr:hypothetical protein J3E74DRAFT_323512 [Bipolaris maydis]